MPDPMQTGWPQPFEPRGVRVPIPAEPATPPVIGGGEVGQRKPVLELRQGGPEGERSTQAAHVVDLVALALGKSSEDLAVVTIDGQTPLAYATKVLQEWSMQAPETLAEQIGRYENAFTTEAQHIRDGQGGQDVTQVVQWGVFVEALKVLQATVQSESTSVTSAPLAGEPAVQQVETAARFSAPSSGELTASLQATREATVMSAPGTMDVPATERGVRVEELEAELEQTSPSLDAMDRIVEGVSETLRAAEEQYREARNILSKILIHRREVRPAYKLYTEAVDARRKILDAEENFGLDTVDVIAIFGEVSNAMSNRDLLTNTQVNSVTGKTPLEMVLNEIRGNKDRTPDDLFREAEEQRVAYEGSMHTRGWDDQNIVLLLREKTLHAIAATKSQFQQAA